MPPRPRVPTDDQCAPLEGAADASYEAIEIAWRALLKRHHPDIAGATALETAKRINVAHDWLSDPQLRATYDAERHLPRPIGRGAWRDGTPEGARPVARRPVHRAP